MTDVSDHPPPEPSETPAPSSASTARAVGIGAALAGAVCLVLAVVFRWGVEADRGPVLYAGTALVLVGLALAAANPALYGRTAAGSGLRAARVLVPAAAVVLAVIAVWTSDGGDRAASGDGVELNGHAHESGHGHGEVSGGPAEGQAATGTGGHVHGEGPAVPLDATTQKQLTEQLAVAREATMRYPTVADATAAGLRRIGTFAPGSGAHYMAGMPVPFDPGQPTMWIYAGNEPTSPVVGLMYYSLDAAEPPEGFAGPNDHWHQHIGLCLKDTPEGETDLPLPVDRDVSEEACLGVGGRFLDTTGWMIHVWTAPGWESPEGVFSHDHKLLVCSDGKSAAEAELHIGCRGMA
jgi:hypothetical protein